MQQNTAIDYKSLYEGAQLQLKETLGAVAMLQHRIAQLEKMIFGSKHERFVPLQHHLANWPWIYAIERRCRDKGLSVEGRKEIRQKEAVPILHALGKWMKEQLLEVLPKSPIGKALAYSVK